MEYLLLVVILFIVLGLPAIAGMYAVWWNTTSPAKDDTTHPSSHDSVYRRGVELAKTPAALLFIPLALASIYIQVFVIGYGNIPTVPILAARILGIVLLLAVYIGGLTVAGTVLAVYTQTRLSEDIS